MSVESQYQKSLISLIEKQLPGSIVLKNDSGHRQGIPDLTVFYKDRWCWLEVKSSPLASYQPNQEYYLDWANLGSLGVTIYPQNEREVLARVFRYLLRRPR